MESSEKNQLHKYALKKKGKNDLFSIITKGLQKESIQDIKILKSRVEEFIKKNMENFFLTAKFIDYTSPPSNVNTLMNIQIFHYGVKYIISKYHEKKWISYFRSGYFNSTLILIENYDYIYSNIYDYTQNNIHTQNDKNLNRNEKWIGKRLISIERQLLQIISQLFTFRHPKYFVRQDQRILLYIISSVNSMNLGNCSQALIIVQSLLKEKSFHHHIFTSFQILAMRLNFDRMIDIFLNQNLDLKENIKIKKYIIVIFNRIYFSQSGSSLHHILVKEIQSSDFKDSINQLKSNKVSNKVEDIKYWKKKYFELEEQETVNKNAKLNEQQHKEELNNLFSENQKLTLLNTMLEEDIRLQNGKMEDIFRTLLPLKGLIMAQEENLSIENIPDLLRNINGFIEKVRGIRNTTNRKLSLSSDTNSILTQNTDFQKSVLTENESQFIPILGDIYLEELKDDSVVSTVPIMDMDVGVDCPPPPMDVDSAFDGDLFGNKKKFSHEIYISFLGNDVVEYLKQKENFDELAKGLPFLHLQEIEKNIPAVNVFTKNLQDPFTLEEIEIYLSTFMKNKSTKEKLNKVKVVLPKSTFILADEYNKKIDLIIKKIPDIDSISENIMNYNIEYFDQELVRKLIIIAPDPISLKKLNLAGKNNMISNKNEIRIFNIWKIPHAFGFIRFIKFYLGFDELVQNLNNSFQVLDEGCKLLIENNLLADIFKNVLNIANFTNFFKKKQPIKAFSVENFEWVLNTKSGNEEETILTYLLKNRFNSAENHASFIDIFKILSKLVKVSISELKNDLNYFWDSVENSEMLLNSSTLVEHVRKFYLMSVEIGNTLNELNSSINIIISKIKINYCVDSSVKPEEFFENLWKISQKIQFEVIKMSQVNK